MRRRGWLRKAWTAGQSTAAALVVSLTPWTSHTVPATDGLYATFEVRRGGSLVGEFTCRLEHALAPRTVASFVGLAEGSRGWLNFQRGGVSARPFYDGITFHRVVPSFVIQAGSPNGLGTDGPGYTFRDEFHPSLRHSKAGILSMANSGLHSNGSQFFITLAATPHLDDLHSVFGEVVENLAVMQSVQQGDVIARVTITRVGAAAQAFNVQTQGLPVVSDAQPALVKDGVSFRLHYTQTDDAEHFVHHSNDLAVWQQLSGQELYIAPPAQTPRDVTSLTTGAPRKFFAVTRVQYPDALHTPASVAGRSILLTDPRGFSFTWNLQTASSGTYTTSLAQGILPIHSYSWTQEAYRGRLTGSISGLQFQSGEPITQVNISFHFTSPTGGTCRGSVIGASGENQFPMSGTFTVTNL
jgi:peptidyl-prolyl cis-trans isomerase A (cyclophilin A)